MSWPGEEWKVGLPAQALKAIAEVEQRLERLQKERQQKQVQLDTLEAVMHKQRQKHEEERASWALLSQQNRSLSEACEQTERARQRLAQELQAKEAQLSCLEAQQAQAARRQAELEEELRGCQVELEKLQSCSHLVMLPPRWGSPTPWAKGGAEAKAELGKGLGSATEKAQASNAPLGGLCEQEAILSVTENGKEVQSVEQEPTSAGEKLMTNNQELRLALAQAETRLQEKEKELWALQGQLELTKAELAQSKKQHGKQAEAGTLGCRGRRMSEDVGHQRRSREQQKGLIGREVAPSSGSRCRSTSFSRSEQPADKGGTPSKHKGSLLGGPHGQSTPKGQEEVQNLKAEVLVLRRRLDASESQRKTLLETCWQQEKTRSWAPERQAPLLGLRALSWQKKKEDQDDQVLDGKQVAEKREGETLQSEEDSAKLDVPKEVQAEMEANAPGKMPPFAEEEDLSKEQPLEGNVEALREELRVLAAGKAEAEAQASLVQQKLQSLQTTLGRQTERLAQAMETQTHHVEELLVDGEEKDRLIIGLRKELEDTKKALDMANAEGQRLRVLMEHSEEEPHRDNSKQGVEVGTGEVPTLTQDAKAGENPQDAELTQLEASLAQLVQENQALQDELARWKARSVERGDGGRSVVSGKDGEAAEGEERKGPVLEASQQSESLSQVRRRDAQTQTEGPEASQRRRERVSVAFDDTQYEPYGLPEVVMKGFADIPSGPSCPYVLRRGILGSAPVARMAPRAEPEEDSLEADEGTGV
ncbi:centromere protein F-like [Anolis sagrei]|uniref:centromere protein F-like n=1 Tax=Anolis sagrei TaxID=38937 RepID=UPI00351FDFB9